MGKNRVQTLVVSFCSSVFAKTTLVYSSSRKLVILFIVIGAAVIVLGLGDLFLLVVLLSSQRFSSHSCETLRELIHDPEYMIVNNKGAFRIGGTRIA